MKRGRGVGTLALLLVVMLLGACAARPVKCDAHLVPINAAHPKDAHGAPK